MSTMNKRTWQQKSTAIALALFSMTYGSGLVFANPAVNELPTGGTVKTSGANGAIISTQGNTMTIDQIASGKDRLALDWQTFNIGKDATVNFNQHAADIALNRVTGGASEIFGHLNAGGTVLLINPNGVLFGKDAQVNVGSIVASTMNVKDKDLQSFVEHNTNRVSFEGAQDAQGKIINAATINAQGGLVALFAQQVDNQGTINNLGGTVNLAAGSKAHIDFDGSGKINLVVDDKVMNAAAINSGTISANGGYVVMTARDASKVLNTVVNNSGVITAQRLTKNDRGEILLDGGDNGVVEMSGTLDVSGTAGNQNGGDITVKGQYLSIDGKYDANGKIIKTAPASIKADGYEQGGTITTEGTNILVGKNTVVSASAAEPNGKAGVWNINSVNTATIATISDEATGLLNQLKAAQAAAEDARSKADAAAKDAAEKQKAAEVAAQDVKDAQAKLDDLQKQAADKETQNKRDSDDLQKAKEDLTQATNDYNTKQAEADVAAKNAATSETYASYIDGLVNKINDAYDSFWECKKVSKIFQFDDNWRELARSVDMVPYVHNNDVEKFFGVASAKEIDEAANKANKDVQTIKDNDAAYQKTTADDAMKAKGLVDTNRDSQDKAQNAADASRGELNALNGQVADQNKAVSDLDGKSKQAQQDADGAKTASAAQDKTRDGLNNKYKTAWANAGTQIDNSVLSNSLNSTNVNITTSGTETDIKVNGGISKTAGSAGTQLTLDAQRNVVLTQAINAGDSKLNLVMKAGEGDEKAMKKEAGHTAGNRYGANIIEADIHTAGDVTMNNGTYFGLTQDELAKINTKAVSRTVQAHDIKLDGDVILATGKAVNLTASGNVDVTGSINSGNAYTYVAGNGTNWKQAQTDAGKNGSYLATITSGIEDSAVAAAVNDQGDAFIGAQSIGWQDKDGKAVKEWHWVAGPEVGKTFFVQTIKKGDKGYNAKQDYNSQSSYTNFANGEPNDNNGKDTQQAVVINGRSGKAQQGRWDDRQANGGADRADGYVKETNLAATSLNVIGKGNVVLEGQVGNTAKLNKMFIRADKDITTKGLVQTINDIGLYAGDNVQSLGGLSSDKYTVGIVAGKDILTQGNIRADQLVTIQSNKGNAVVESNIDQFGDHGLITNDGKESLHTVNIIALNGTATTKGSIEGKNVSVLANAVDVQNKMTATAGTVGLMANQGDIKVASAAELKAAKDVMAVANKGNVDLQGNIISGGGTAYISAEKNVNLKNINAQGSIFVASNGTGVDAGTITLNGKLASQASGNQAVVVGTNGQFINKAGEDAIDARNGHWKVYAHAPEKVDDFGNLDSKTHAIWNDAFAARRATAENGGYNAAKDDSNRYIFAVQPTANISVQDTNKTYGDAITNYEASVDLLTYGDQNLLAYRNHAFDETGAVTATASSAGFAAEATRTGGQYTDTRADSWDTDHKNHAIYDIKAEGKNDTGYAFAAKNARLTINRRKLTFKMEDINVAYGTDLNTFNGKYHASSTDWRNGDKDKTSLHYWTTAYGDGTKGQPTSWQTKDVNAPDKPYWSGAFINDPDVAMNYDVHNIGNVNITKADLTLNNHDMSFVYGTNWQDALRQRTAEGKDTTFTGLTNGDEKLSRDEIIKYQSAAFKKDYTGTQDVGTYWSGVKVTNDHINKNYNIANAATRDTITKARLTVTTTGVDTTYGTVNKGYTTAYDKLVNGDRESGTGLVYDDSAAYHKDAQGVERTANVGSYDVTGRLTDARTKQNYDITYVDGKINIGQAALTLTTQSINTTYGTVNTAYQTTNSGMANGDSQDDLNVTHSTEAYTNHDTRTNNVGTYGINTAAHGTIAKNYYITYNDGSVGVGTKAIHLDLTTTGTLGSQTISDNGSYAAGLVNGDTMDKVPAAHYALGSQVSGDTYNYDVTIGSTKVAATGTVVGNYRFTYDGVVDVYMPQVKPKEDYRNPANLDGNGQYGFGQGNRGGVPGVERVAGLTDAQLPFFKVANKQVYAYGTYDVTETPKGVKLTASAKRLPEPNQIASQYRSLDTDIALTEGSGKFTVSYNGSTLNIYPAEESAKVLLQEGDATHNEELAAKALFTSFNKMGLVLDDLDGVYIHTDATESEAKA